MREYMKNLGTVLMMISLSNMLIPNGSMKKFASLAAGFMIITAALSFLPKNTENINFSVNSGGLDEETMVKAQKNYEKQVLEKHRKNLEEEIAKKFRYKSFAEVETNEKGEITTVTLRISGDESEAVGYIVNTLKFPRERIRIINEKI